MPGYGSILRAIYALSKHEAAVTLAYGMDPSALGGVVEWTSTPDRYSLLHRSPCPILEL